MIHPSRDLRLNYLGILLLCQVNHGFHDFVQGPSYIKHRVDLSLWEWKITIRQILLFPANV